MTRSLPALALLFALACGSSGPARCDTCGMIVAPESGWRAGAEGLAFDAPKCLFRHALRRGALRDPWVIEYYSQERRPAAALLYVLGADLESPMGRDLVPVDGAEAAERLRADHGGQRILRYDEIDAALIEALFE